jgi:predicted signal transduction protein with EAL and GGDEF domain
MPIASAPPAGFQQQFQQFMYYAGPIVQIIFWAGMLVIALLAYLQFKRLVDARVAALTAKTQAGHVPGLESGAILVAAAGSDAAGADDIAVEEFAE